MANLHPTTDDLSIQPWLSRCAYPLARYLVLPAYFGKIRIEGRENIPTDGPVIVAPTHRSRWDGVLVPYAVGRIASGRDPHFMVSADEMKGIQGWAIRQFGGFPVDLSRAGLLNSIRTSVELLEQGKMLTVFPEGGIFRTPDVQPLKPGVARMAVQAQNQRGAIAPSVKVLPVSMQYTQEFPSWGSQVHINIGEPLDVASYNLETLKTASKQLTEDLKLALETLNGQHTVAPASLETVA
ncbi:MAG: lysophospholipid acyltransferase family protein [Cyanobacteria bacterium J06641_5]